MREPPRNGTIPPQGAHAQNSQTQGARESGQGLTPERTAEELDALATPPPPPLTYRDDSPDTVRREPKGRQSAAGEVKELSERAGSLNVTGQVRQQMLGKLREAAGSTGVLAGQLLGGAIQGSLAIEEQIRRVADRAQRREESAGAPIETLATGASHAEQERAGKLGARLADWRAALSERSPIELSPKATGVLAVILGLAGMAGVVVLRRLWRERQQRTRSVETARADGESSGGTEVAEAAVAIPQATLPLADGLLPGVEQAAIPMETPARGGASYRLIRGRVFRPRSSGERAAEAQ